MRQLLTGLAAVLLLVPAVPARAQQGSVQVSAAAQVTTGDSARLGDQNRVEPDIGISWLQPGTRFGIFQVELRGTRRGESARLGRTFVALRDVKFGGVAWSFEGGDSYFAPAIGDYRVANLFTPAVTFMGGSVTGRTAHGSLQVLAGRVSASRNIFGSDPETLDQDVGLVRASHRYTRLEIGARASRIRTRDLKEFNFTIAASDQAGGGAKLWLTPDLQLVGDASLVSFRRVGATTTERDVSFVAGSNWLHKRGWVQVNASHFAAGDFAVLNNPLQDREGVFAAGEYDVLDRLRLSGGWEAFRLNVNPLASLAGSNPQPRSRGSREFAGIRLRLTGRTAIAFRGEQGDRLSKPLQAGSLQDSDTGWWAAEWQGAVGKANAFVRYTRRENVDHRNALSSYTQHDSTAQLFMNVSRTAQVFGTVMFMRNAVAEGGTTYWQAGGGAQLQLPRRDLWLRGEATLARNLDLFTQNLVPHESVSVGLNGQLTRRTAVAFNVNVDRSPFLYGAGNPWTTRSMLRVTRSLPTGSAYNASASALTSPASGRGTGSIVGSVFADWNGNGTFDTGDAPLEGIPLRIISGGATTSGHDGNFSFASVPVGLRDVGVDTGALPVDFDPPAVTSVQLEIARGDTRRVAFGLIPLGTIAGRVVRDTNGNGKADADEEPVDGAVIVLDDGVRSERVRNGRYIFEAVRAGDHEVKLLTESLPPEAVITGAAAVPMALTREHMSGEVPFVVSIQVRPEIRRVFPPRPAAATPGARRASRQRAASRRRPLRRRPLLRRPRRRRHGRRPPRQRRDRRLPRRGQRPSRSRSRPSPTSIAPATW